MPIEGLSNLRRLPRLGHIRLGIKKVSQQSGKEYPCEVDHFILDPKTGDRKWDDDLKDQFSRRYGEKPKAIKFCFPPADIDLVFPHYYKAYSQSALLVCKGDGVEAATSQEEWAKRLPALDPPLDEKGMFRIRCDGDKCPYSVEKKCRRVANLQIMLPELTGLGVFQINTSSWNNIIAINSIFDWLKGLCGRWEMIPLTLTRVEQEIAYEGKKARHYLLKFDTQSVSLMDLQKSALIPVTRFALPPPDESRDELLDPPGGHEPEALPAPAAPIEAEAAPEAPPAEKAQPAPPAKPAQNGPPAGISISKEMQPIVNQVLKHRQRVGEEAFTRTMGDVGISSMEQVYGSKSEAIRFLNALVKVKNKEPK